ncbi:XTP/dITP diphosphohydrolase [Pelagirhabdus alkalitolerans]|uniref:dITP/XTP pyrophosphatase n=1 Tax=Pelagirhabdus alkalitolerans TaxID=1612202 RepID=A0A1G6HPB1_9BACI|nr:XTP/dITP diphosphatase [Pelagirhabdus alkalitolerans]SDB95336.1 XTP/dITP diphosphohydrolase [Pelagirhabdus alkalitolerans]
MKKILIATQNRGKVNDFKTLFEPKQIAVWSLLDIDDIEDVEETGTTFAENATLKAETIANRLNMPVLADDSGLEVDALNKEPGVYSARYAGTEKNDQKNLEKVLDNLKGVSDPNRTARFVCALALAKPNEETIIEYGYCEGEITKVPQGDQGFGYDPIFKPKGYTKTMGELPIEEKNKISHRRQALQHLAETLEL